MKEWNLKQADQNDKQGFLKLVQELRELRKLTPGEEAIVIDFIEKNLS